MTTFTIYFEDRSIYVMDIATMLLSKIKTPTKLALDIHTYIVKHILCFNHEMAVNNCLPSTDHNI